MLKVDLSDTSDRVGSTPTAGVSVSRTQLLLMQSCTLMMLLNTHLSKQIALESELWVLSYMLPTLVKKP